ncbi:MAG TPA: LuxR C-terminal-related transcriptional regulator [Chitinophagaceae bacterium]|nr:LuxR C-terminal-related transcriptional regulator [Chitinophagaceae bacterium]
MPPKNVTYEQYLELMADFSGMKMQEESDQLIAKFSDNHQISSKFAPVIFLLDYTTKQYIYVDDACFTMFGFKASYFLETGLDEYLRKWHPADYEILNKYVQPSSISFFKTIQAEKWMDYFISYNYRFLNASGEYKTVLQRSSYIPGGAQGLPRGIIGVIFDITHFKNDLSIVHTIEETRSYDHEIVNKVVLKKVYPLIEFKDNRLVSNREKEILKHIAAGMSSKQIADILKISVNTINNHRKNMLAKTNCRTSAELMNYATKHGML